MRGTRRVVRAVVWLLLATALVLLSPLAATGEASSRASAETTKSQSSEHREEKLRERTPGVAVQRRCVERAGRSGCLFKLDFRTFFGADQVPSADERSASGGNSHELGLRKRTSAVVLSVFRL